jgi:hypothetical protein
MRCKATGQYRERSDRLTSGASNANRVQQISGRRPEAGHCVPGTDFITLAIYMKRNYFDILGWAGAAVSFSAYTMNTQQILASSSVVFLSMNIFACTCMIVYTFRKKAFANTAINSAFLMVTLAAIGSGLFQYLK